MAPSSLEGLARVVSQLVLGNAEVRLELGTTGGTRMLWFKRGQIIAAESSLDHEGLIARARRDGLIDARQDTELRMLKGATPREQLEALKARGFIRDIESVPLVQRYTEQVALDAFTEEKTLYRVVEEAPRPEVLLATVPRPTLPMLAESLRRAVAPDVMLERLGGGEAVPVATDSELDLRALGFSERERKMLTWVDGEATIEDLSLASGLKPDLAFRALLVAQLLGIIEVRPGVKRTEPNSGQLDLQRLEAKFDEVQDADYFTILGLSRAAGTEDVRRAFQRLAQEFDPLRFSGHPDPVGAAAGPGGGQAPRRGGPRPRRRPPPGRVRPPPPRLIGRANCPKLRLSSPCMVCVAAAEALNRSRNGSRDSGVAEPGPEAEGASCREGRRQHPHAHQGHVRVDVRG